MRESRRNIEGFPNYQASSNGVIINKNTGRILRSNPDTSGYYSVGLSRNGRMYTKRVHRLIAEAFLDQPNDESWQVNHKNGDKKDNRLENLEFVSPSDNMHHAYTNGLNHWAGYSETPVRVVETGEIFKSQAECARAIGGSQANINACLTGRRRSHLGLHYEYVT